jgi:hypothetical protein
MGSLSAVLWWPCGEMIGVETLLTILRYYAMAREIWSALRIDLKSFPAFGR